LCAGLGVTRAETGLDLTTAGALFVTDDGAASPRLSRSRRIGVDYAGAWAARRLRFFVAGIPTSRAARAERPHPSRRA